MMENIVIPLLIERMGGVKAMKVRILRTAAVGESNVDRVIGDLMTGTNPSVGLAAHPGQTDVRIAAKADTEAEADALIAPVEAQLTAAVAALCLLRANCGIRCGRVPLS